uniref:EF-hand domain-containing protein n=1 Tax=Pyrodinium bahamense TaxID=73915 RepID=A0A7S0FKV5_9DINO|mmetsp:Transcript_35918/g.99600  ORF Transcript_35918/g.99600 Transcript_35918/m.99600 type:complete len:181 (+) Transcript_35918:120-662(+)
MAKDLMQFLDQSSHCPRMGARSKLLAEGNELQPEDVVGADDAAVELTVVWGMDPAALLQELEAMLGKAATPEEEETLHQEIRKARLELQVQRWTRVVRPKLQDIESTDPEVQKLEVFRLFDDDETGKISFKNLKRVSKELGEKMTDCDLQEMIEEADRDEDGEVNEDEFSHIMQTSDLWK